MNYSKIPRSPEKDNSQKHHFEMSSSCCPINNHLESTTEAPMGKEQDQLVYLMTEVRPTHPMTDRHK